MITPPPIPDAARCRVAIASAYSLATRWLNSSRRCRGGSGAAGLSVSKVCRDILTSHRPARVGRDAAAAP
jgi:hypothetical protein